MSSDKKYCPYCGKQNLSFAKYCAGCGYEIPEDKFASQNNQKTQQDTEQNHQSETYVRTPRVRKKRGYGRLIVLIALATLFIYLYKSK